MENKICVYAICKNEKKFVKKWLDSMQEADYIVVLDTGSDDGTYEELSNDPRVTRVTQKTITPWRFDVARNESLKLVPEDANILICTDLDEILRPGWAQALRGAWVEGKHYRGYYQYIWSHTDSGDPGRVFAYDKIHDRHWIWKYPVHEMLHDELGRELKDHTIMLWNDVILEHFPDMTKSRSSYLPLLELRAKENPDDYYGLFYLSHEYNYRGMYDKSIDLLKRLVSEFKDRFSSTELAAAYLFLGDDYRKLDDKERAIYYYTLGIQAEPSYRECYLNAAEVFNELRMYEAAEAYVKMAIEKGYRHYVWVERDNSYKGQPHDILAVAQYYIATQSKYVNKSALLREAYANVIVARKFNPDDSRLKYNQDCIERELSKL